MKRSRRWASPPLRLAAIPWIVLLCACPPPDPVLEAETPPVGPDLEDIDFLSPSGSVTSPVTFELAAPANVAWVRLTEMQAGVDLGDSTDAAHGFLTIASFPLPGLRRVAAFGYDEDDQIVARGERSFEVVLPPGGRHGLWLYDLAATGLSAEELAARTADLGVGRLLVRVAEGPLDCVAVPNGCDAALTAALRDAGVVPWAVFDAVPEDPEAQAEALFDLLPLHYEGVLLRTGDRFDGRDEELAALVEAFVIVRGRCVGQGLHSGEFPLLAARPDGTSDPVAQMVDGWAPEADGDLLQERWCQLEGASDRPIWPVLNADVADAEALDELLGRAGADASIVRVPDAAGADEGWAKLEALDWGRQEFQTPDCGR
jgi:hypothetical protein